MHRAAVLLLIAVGLSGCVAVWGRAYNIESETSESVTIKYDRNFTTLKDVNKVAQANCAEIGKKAVERHATTSIWQITTVTYGCVKG